MYECRMVDIAKTSRIRVVSGTTETHIANVRRSAYKFMDGVSNMKNDRGSHRQRAEAFRSMACVQHDTTDARKYLGIANVQQTLVFPT